MQTDNGVQIFVDLATAIEASETEGENQEKVIKLEVAKTGRWRTPGKGNFEISASDLQDIADHYNQDVRPRSSTHGLPVDEEHDKGKARAWLKEPSIEANDQGGKTLFMNAHLTKTGRALVEDGTYKFFSPEIHFRYTDPEGKLGTIRNVLLGGGFTNRPLFKGLAGVPALTANEGEVDENNKIYYLNAEENDKMDLATLRAKKKEEVDEEGMKVLTAAKDQLTDEERSRFGLDGQGAGTGTGTGAGGVQANEGDPKPGKKVTVAGIEATENEDGTVTLTASEFAKIKDMKSDIALGVEASEKLRRNEAEKTVDQACFSEKDGFKFPSEMREELVTTYLAADDSTKATLEKMWKNAKPVVDPGEMGVQGSDADGAGDATQMLEDKATEIQASERGKNMTWRQALQLAGKENPDLAKEASKQLDAGMPQVTSK